MKRNLTKDWGELTIALMQDAGGLENLVRLRDMQRRKIWISEDIGPDIYWEINSIFTYNAEDKNTPVEQRKPILVYCSSLGGEIDDGFAMIDAILQSKTPVYTVNTGYQYSMAFLIGLAGHKRFAMPNAKFLLHDGSSMVYNSASKARDYMEFSQRVEQRIRQYILARTKVTQEEYDARLRQEWYLFADEAKKYGMIDYIIGQDCGMEEVV